jgi:Fuc2NAc and GlcNAc transferase
MLLSILSLASFALVAVLVAGVIKLAPLFGLVDLPVARSAHTHPKPLGGGVALAAPYFLCVSWLAMNGHVSGSLAAYIACLLIVFLGFGDDLWQLTSRVRLPIQFLLGAVAVRAIGVGSVDFGWFTLSQPLLLTLLAVVSLVWLLNLTNFMDGIDGIAGAQLVFTSVGCVLLLSTGTAPGDELLVEAGEFDVVIILAAVLAASGAGFLLWNWSPASIFMGDAGSGFIGFAIGLLALESLASEKISVWSWLLLLGVFIADTAVTLVNRVARGEKWYEGHSQHAYQILSRRLQSHSRVVWILVIIDVLWLFPLAWLAGILPHYGVLFATIGLLPLFAASHLLGAGIDNAGGAETAK